MYKKNEGERTYGIARSILLLRADDQTLTLGGVQGALALDDGLAGGGTATVLAADLSDAVPVAHCEGGWLIRL